MIMRILLAIVVLMVGSCVTHTGLALQADRRFERLLRGDATVRIESVKIHGQQMTIRFDDQDAIDYLTTSIRQAKAEGYVPTHCGYSYSATVDVGSSLPITVGFSPADPADGVTIGFPNDSLDDPKYYWVEFPQPIPTPIADALRRMRTPHR